MQALTKNTTEKQQLLCSRTIIQSRVNGITHNEKNTQKHRHTCINTQRHTPQHVDQQALIATIRWHKSHKNKEDSQAHHFPYKHIHTYTLIHAHLRLLTS